MCVCGGKLGEINKTKDEKNVAEKKKKKGVLLVIRVVWGKGMNKSFFFLSKLMKKKLYYKY